MIGCNLYCFKNNEHFVSRGEQTTALNEKFKFYLKTELCCPRKSTFTFSRFSIIKFKNYKLFCPRKSWISKYN